VYEFDFSVVFENLDVFVRGALLTLQISCTAMIAGLAVALVTLLARTSRSGVLRWLAGAYIEVIRNTPFLLQLFFFFFGLPSLGVKMSANVAAFVALTINGGAYAAEILRGGVLSIDRGQREAGRALGLTPFQVFRYIVLKPAMRATYPALTSQFVLLMLTSSIVASISASELTSMAQALDSVTFRSFEIYFVVTLIYLAISLLLIQFFKRLQRILFPYPAR
jgi:polar amino acid transport system permease protein